MGIFASFHLDRGKHENGYYMFIVSIKICTLGNLCSYFPTILLYLLCFFPPPPFIFISWRLITLQYYSGFCHTLT